MARAYRGVALAALGVIVLVTVAWWALALYPAGAATPEWVARTRLVCFGAMPGGLPSAGGWVLLVGEPWGRWRCCSWCGAMRSGATCAHSRPARGEGSYWGHRRRGLGRDDVMSLVRRAAARPGRSR